MCTSGHIFSCTPGNAFTFRTFKHSAHAPNSPIFGGGAYLNLALRQNEALQQHIRKKKHTIHTNPPLCRGHIPTFIIGNKLNSSRRHRCARVAYVCCSVCCACALCFFRRGGGNRARRPGGAVAKRLSPSMTQRSWELAQTQYHTPPRPQITHT